MRRIAWLPVSATYKRSCSRARPRGELKPATSARPSTKSRLPVPMRRRMRPSCVHSRMRWLPVSAMYSREAFATRPPGTTGAPRAPAVSRRGVSTWPGELRKFASISASKAGCRASMARSPTKRSRMKPRASTKTTVGHALRAYCCQAAQSPSLTSGSAAPSPCSTSRATAPSRSWSNFGTCTAMKAALSRNRAANAPTVCRALWQCADPAFQNSSTTGWPRSPASVMGAVLIHPIEGSNSGAMLRARPEGAVEAMRDHLEGWADYASRSAASARKRSSSVSMPGGKAAGLRATAMRCPASSTRNCSRASSCSRRPGGRDWNTRRKPAR